MVLLHACRKYTKSLVSNSVQREGAYTKVTYADSPLRFHQSNLYRA